MRIHENRCVFLANIHKNCQRISPRSSHLEIQIPSRPANFIQAIEIVWETVEFMGNTVSWDMRRKNGGIEHVKLMQSKIARLPGVSK